MCLELEQKGAVVSGSKIRVDRAYYKRWDIDDSFRCLSLTGGKHTITFFLKNLLSS